MTFTQYSHNYFLLFVKTQILILGQALDRVPRKYSSPNCVKFICTSIIYFLKFIAFLLIQLIPGWFLWLFAFLILLSSVCLTKQVVLVAHPYRTSTRLRVRSPRLAAKIWSRLQLCHSASGIKREKYVKSMKKYVKFRV